ncbi:MAG TPA: copper chaperone CopZ [Candidatus Atribacteria bacterium]|nr:copper chaperone CopZ [Candidatus Atribacteria bacterium]HPT78492.1 copper chaperone CopZ [Candidatus Atribacteria bacterium]
MERTVLHVEGMSCSHCENAVKKAVGALDGVRTVEVDLKGKTVSVEYDSSRVSLDRIKSEIEEQGYDVV